MKAQLFELERRRVAILAEQVTDGELELAGLWTELTSGRTRVVDSFIDDERCYLLLVPSETERALSSRRRCILEAVLCGQSAKVLAFDLCLSHSTISQEAKLALRHFGVDCSPCRANPLFAMSARAAVDGRLNHRARLANLRDGEQMLGVVGVARPEGRLAPVLPPAEFAVVRALMEGRNYFEIAANRGTSTRTVANQLAAAFRKLGVSGRGSLLNHVASL